MVNFRGDDRSIRYVYRVAIDTMAFILLLAIAKALSEIVLGLFEGEADPAWLKQSAHFIEIGMYVVAVAGFGHLLIKDTLDFVAPPRRSSRRDRAAKTGREDLEQATPAELREKVEAKLNPGRHADSSGR